MLNATVQTSSEPTFEKVETWLPEGKRAAVCFTIDDVHPGRSDQHYDGGGDLQDGALGLVEGLLERHERLKVTLFVTADWREISPTPNPLLKRLPYLRERLYLTKILPAGSRRLDRAPNFVEYLKRLPRTEVAHHGLHHVHRGPQVHVEFQDESEAECREVLTAMCDIFAAAGLKPARGICPPGWNAPPNLLTALEALNFEFVASARDINTVPDAQATAQMSGLRGVPLQFPAIRRQSKLVSITTNFQATSSIDRARRIIETGGLLAVKAHIIKNAMGHVAVDGVDALYMNYLDLLFARLEEEYGDDLWWTSMGEVATRVRRVA